LQPVVRTQKCVIVTSVALSFTSTDFARTRNLEARFPKAFSTTPLARRIKVTVERKFSRVHAMKVYKLSGGTDPLVPKLGTKCEESGEPHAPQQFCLR
jgi:hypothetical protein